MAMENSFEASLNSAEIALITKAYIKVFSAKNIELASNGQSQLATLLQNAQDDLSRVLNAMKINVKSFEQ